LDEVRRETLGRGGHCSAAAWRDRQVGRGGLDGACRDRAKLSVAVPVARSLAEGYQLRHA